MSVREACEMLGVHEATLRRWTKEGYLPAFRTPGGHRRYLKREVLAFLARGQTSLAPAALEALTQRTLSETRRELGMRLPSEPLRPHYRDREPHLRASGRELLGLLLHYAAREQGNEAYLKRGIQTMRHYGEEAAELGLSVPETARAFLVFRQAIVEAISRSLDQPPGADPEGWRLLRRAGHFFDALLVATLEGYEQRRQRQVALAPQGGGWA